VQEGSYKVKGSPQNAPPRLYGDLAWLWPIISSVEDYSKEAEFFARTIQEESQVPVSTLLDIGCGGGHLDNYLKKHFQITAADISEPMLELARMLNPEVVYLTGDMCTMRLGQLFDTVIIHDAINYMLNPADLKAAFQTAFEHLRPGGVFLTFVEVMTRSFQQNKTFVTSRSRGDTEVVFIENYYDPDPHDTTYEGTYVYLIRQKGHLSVETDRHLGGVFPLETWRSLLKQVGFVVKQREWKHSEFVEGKALPLLVCTKPGENAAY